VNVAIEYLLSYLRDELRSNADGSGGERSVRIRPVQPSTLLRSPDLEQDYDPGRSDLHRRAGVLVLIASREYFFPSEWVTEKKFSEIAAQASEIRRFLGSDD
jgi:hypothetical protein